MAAAIDHVGVQARFEPRRLAAIDLAQGERWSYADLDLDTARAAAVLLARGVGPGDRVATIARNRVVLVVLHLACARIGAVYVPLNWRLSPVELAALVADAAPTLLIGDDELGRAGLAGVALDAVVAEIATATPAVTGPIDRSQPSLILYTSGTSGRPKGVLLSEGNLDATAVNLGRLARLTHDSRFLVDSPMFHIIGLITSVRPVLLHGGAFLVSDGFVPSRTLARIADPALAVTHYFCVPQMAAALRAEPAFDPADFARMTGVFTGGAPHPAASIRAWHADGIPIVDGFGMSEAGTVFGMPLDLDQIVSHAGSAGIAMPGCLVRVVNGAGDECAAGDAGELLLKGVNVFGGYWQRPDETARAFTDDGWFRTGDIAVADADGFHAIVDRKKDMFISGGENVYPAEIEAALAGHPAIAECAVVGIPDDRWGEVGHVALIVASGQSLDHDGVIEWLGARLARYKLPKYTSVLDTFPRTGSGKVIKAELRAQLTR